MRAIVLGRAPVGEDSVSLDIYSAEHGREMVRVRAAAKMDSKLRYGCEPFSTIEADVVVGKNGLVATSLVPLELRPVLRHGLTRLACAFAVTEAVAELTPEGVSEPELFELLEKTLSALEAQNGEQCITTVKRFFATFFTHLGVGQASGEDFADNAAHAETHFSASLPAIEFLAELAR